MKRLRILWRILKITGFNTFVSSFVAYLFISALGLTLIEPQIKTFTDGLWFAFITFLLCLFTAFQACVDEIERAVVNRDNCHRLINNGGFAEVSDRRVHSKVVIGEVCCKLKPLNKEFLDKIDIRKYSYALLPEPNESPVEIVIEYIANNGVGYIYKIAVSQKGVEEESLFVSHFGKTKNDLIYKRTLNHIRFSFDIPKDIKELINRLIQRNPNSSFLALNQEFPVIINPHISESFSWFSESLIVIGTNSNIPTLIDIGRAHV